MPSLLERALTESALRPLPAAAARLLREHDAPPRLGAHLRAVHDVAARLTEWLVDHCPQLTFDRAAVLFGAATHDIGKVVHAEELSAPGSRHEPAGRRLLLDAGVEPRLARFAGTHGSWRTPGLPLEDLLVSVADKVWKGRRETDLEQLLVDRVAAAAGRPPWEAFLAVDDHLTRLADGADDRLAFQNAYPVR